MDRRRCGRAFGPGGLFWRRPRPPPTPPPCPPPPPRDPRAPAAPPPRAAIAGQRHTRHGLARRRREDAQHLALAVGEPDALLAFAQFAAREVKHERAEADGFDGRRGRRGLRAF